MFIYSFEHFRQIYSISWNRKIAVVSPLPSAPPGSPLIRVYFIKSSESIGVGGWGLQPFPSSRWEPKGRNMAQIGHGCKGTHTPMARPCPCLTAPSIWNGTLQRQTLNTNSDAHTNQPSPACSEPCGSTNTPPATLLHALKRAIRSSKNLNIRPTLSFCSEN